MIIEEKQELFRAMMNRILNERELSNGWLAKRIGVTRESIRLKRNGERKIKKEEMQKIAEALGMTLDGMLAYCNILSMGDNHGTVSQTMGHCAAVGDIARDTCEMVVSAMNGKTIEQQYEIRQKVINALKD